MDRDGISITTILIGILIVVAAIVASMPISAMLRKAKVPISL